MLLFAGRLQVMFFLYNIIVNGISGEQRLTYYYYYIITIGTHRLCQNKNN